MIRGLVRLFELKMDQRGQASGSSTENVRLEFVLCNKSFIGVQRELRFMQSRTHNFCLKTHCIIKKSSPILLESQSIFWGHIYFGGAMTVTSDRYRNAIKQFFIPHLRKTNHLNTTFCSAIFSYNPYSPSQFFPNRPISRFEDIPWPLPWSRLTAPDFFLWGQLKDKVFSRQLHTFEELKMANREEFEFRLFHMK
ncbi:hypothetical protein ANN_09814 [Periplaneta americana]|uniref:Uncharacterized protein n=1 Tax=Periplaneta americana TaxID=6978 RepID=A0ABQ8TMC0_PERAM|nr:hypothetical protein ANN_09814 [Periplaneta americana]